MSFTCDVTSSPETNSALRLTGRVKWFNNKAGYGFVTITDGEKSGTDIFVHHSAIKVSNQQYRYLVQGEYIEFSLVNVENSTHECQAAEIGGIKGGKLMCETRREFKIARNSYKDTDATDNETSEPVKMPRQQRVREQTSQSSVPLQTQTQSTDDAWSMVTKPTKKASVDKSTSVHAVASRGRGRPPRSKM